MNLDKNIANAVKVLHNTYDNIAKLVKYVNLNAEKFGYVCVTPNPLVWQNRNNIWGWLVNKVIVVFQHKDKYLYENGWYNDDIFGMEICLNEDEAALYISKFCYKNIEGWSSNRSASNEWGFSHPRTNFEDKFIIEQKGKDTYSEPRNEKYSDLYGGLKKAVFRKDTFSDITSENIGRKVFAVMDELQNLNLCD